MAARAASAARGLDQLIANPDLGDPAERPRRVMGRRGGQAASWGAVQQEARGQESSSSVTSSLGMGSPTRHVDRAGGPPSGHRRGTCSAPSLRPVGRPSATTCTGARTSARARTAASRAASSEKNQIPVRPSGPRTYVRTFVSGKNEAQGTAGPRAARTVMANGTSPTQAEPSNVRPRARAEAGAVPLRVGTASAGTSGPPSASA